MNIHEKTIKSALDVAFKKGCFSYDEACQVINAFNGSTHYTESLEKRVNELEELSKNAKSLEKFPENKNKYKESK